MDEMMKVLVFVVSLVGAGVGAYAGVAVIQVLVKRLEGSKPGPALEEIESLHARLAATESLEARLEELEQRVDFAERLIAQQEPERLAAGRPPDHR